MRLVRNLRRAGLGILTNPGGLLRFSRNFLIFVVIFLIVNVLQQFQTGEEIRNLKGCRFRSIGTVGGVFANIGAGFLT